MINSNIVCIDNQFCYTVKEKHISNIVSSDTIIFIDNKLTTVSKNNIKQDSFIGTTLFGYNYKGGKELVKVVTFCLNPNNI